MKTTTAQICQYIPHGVNVLRRYESNLGNLVSDVVPLTLDNIEYYFEQDNSSEFKSIQVLLRPLNTIAKGEAAIMYGELEVSDVIKSVNGGYVTKHRLERLVSAKYDVFGLIEKGLAVSIDATTDEH